MNLIKETVEYLSFALALAATFIMVTPKIRTGFLCTTGFGLLALGFLGVGYALMKGSDIFYRPMLFIVIGASMILASTAWVFHVKKLPILKRASDFKDLFSN